MQQKEQELIKKDEELMTKHRQIEQKDKDHHLARKHFISHVHQLNTDLSNAKQEKEDVEEYYKQVIDNMNYKLNILTGKSRAKAKSGIPVKPVSKANPITRPIK